MSKIHFTYIAVLVISLIATSYFGLTASRNTAFAQGISILYFQSYKVDFGAQLQYAMDYNVPTGQGISQGSFVGESFCSPPLAQAFTFQTVNITIYHNRIPSNVTGLIQVELKVIDENGQFVSRSSPKINSTYLFEGATVDTVTIDYSTQLLQGDRLVASITGFSGSSSFQLNVYWGNSTFPSAVTFQGEPVFVPEFQIFLALPLFMIMTLAVIVIRRKTSKQDSAREP